jgi:hypothetical protein
MLIGMISEGRKGGGKGEKKYRNILPLVASISTAASVTPSRFNTEDEEAEFASAQRYNI